MSKRIVTITCNSINILTNAVNQIIDYLDNNDMKSDIISFDHGENDKYFACISYNGGGAKNIFSNSVYDLEYSDIRETKMVDYDDFVDPEYGVDDYGELDELIEKENKRLSGKNDNGQSINKLARNLVSSTGNAIDLTEEIMGKKGSKKFSGKPNMNPRRPGMKWDV